MEIQVGSRLASAVCATEVIVIQSPDGDLDITCGGQAMVPAEEAAPGDAGPAPEYSEGTLLGKRYVNGEGNLELLCVKPGDGSLALDGEILQVKGAKPLPSSD